MHDHAPLHIEDLKPGDHLCIIYETENEHQAVLTPFIRQGLERREKVVYIVDALTAERVRGYLEEAGVEVEPYLERGQLQIMDGEAAYLRGGVFDPEAMIQLLGSAAEQALAEGYAALRVTSEMTWVLRGLPGSQRLLEYEAKLNEFSAGTIGGMCLILCQYDRRRFNPSLLLDVLATHPIALMGTEIYDNFYYLPPEEFLGPDPAQAKLGRWLTNLKEHQRLGEVLKASENKCRQLVETLAEGVWSVDKDAYTTFVNPRMAQMLGYTPEEMTGQHLFSFMDEEGREICKRNLEPRRQEIKGEFEFEFLKKDGSRIYTKICSNPWFDDRGNYAGAVAAVTDITAQKQAETELRESEERYRTLVELSPDAIIVHQEGRHVFINPAGASLLGADSPQDLIGTTILDRIHPDHRAAVQKRIEEVYEGKKADLRELQILRVDGQAVDVEATAKDITYQGQPAVQVILRDITEKKRQISDLIRFRRLVDHSLDLVFIVDSDTGYILDVNQTACASLGYTREELLNMRPPDLDIEIFGHRSFFEVSHELKRNGSLSLTGTVCRKDGTTFPVEVKVSQLDQPGIRNDIAIVRDITERKSLEYELDIKNQINEIFLNSPDEQVYAAILDFVRWALKSEFGIFGFFNEDGSFVIPAVTRGIYWEKCRIPEKDIIFEKGTFTGIWAKAVAERRTSYSNTGPFNTPEGHVPIENTVVSPVIFHDRVISFIHLANKPGGYNNDDKKLLETIAIFVAPILNARLERDRKEADRKKTEAVLRESEERHRLLVRQIPAVTFRGYADWNVEFFDEKIEALTGYPKDDFNSRRRKWSDLILPEDLGHIKKAFLAGLNADQDYVRQYRIRKKTGEARWIEERSRIFVDSSGRIQHVSGVIFDVTDQKSREEALRAAYQELKLLQMETIALLEANQAILKNRPFKETAWTIFNFCKKLIGAQSGYVALLSADGTENELLFLEAGGLPCTVDPSLPMPVRGLRAEAYRSGQVVYDNDFPQSEWQEFLPQGHVRLKNVLFAPLVIQGQAQGVLGLANKRGGFTENDRRLAAAFGEMAAIALQNSRTLMQLQQERDFISALLDTLGALVVVLDREGRIIRFNQACEQTTGYSFAEVQNQYCWDLLILPEELELVQHGFKKILSGDFPGLLENYWLTKDGRRRLISWSNTALRDEEGAVSYIIGTGLDVTEHRQADEELAKYRSHLEAMVAERTAELQKTNEELQQARRNWEEIFQAIGHSVLILDPEHTIIDANRATMAILGKEAKQIIGRKCHELFHHCNQPAAGCPAKTLLEKGLSTIVEMEVEGLAGVYLVSCAPVLDNEGHIEKIIHIATDITARKRAEEALIEGERFLTNIFASIRDGISVLDNNYNIIRVNPAMEQAYPRSWPLVGKKCYQAYHGRSQPCEVCPTRRTMETQEAAQDLVIERTPEGEIFRYIDLSTFPLIDPASGKLAGVVEYVRDITGQRRIELALQETQEQYRLLVNQIPAVVFKGYADWSVDFYDRKIEKLSGYRIEDFDSRRIKWCDLIPAEDLDYVKSVAFQALDTESKSFVQEHRIIRKDGESRWVQCRGQIICDARGKIDYISGVTFDITDRKEMEQNLARLNRLYWVLSQTNEAILRIKDANELFQEACRIAVEEGHLQMAWVGLIDPETLLVRPVAKWGADEGYLDEVVVSSRDVPEGRGPTGIAIRENRVVECNDWEHNPLIAPWREKGLKREFYSSMSIPLEEENRIIGALTFYASEPNFFTQDEVNLFKSLRDNISFGLTLLKQEQRRLKAEDALRTSQARLAEAQRLARLGNWDWNIITDELAWSDEVYHLFGVPPQEFGATYEAFLGFVHPGDRELVEGAVKEALQEGKAYVIDHRIIRRDGSEHIVHEQGEIVSDDSGQPIRMFGTVQDVTEHRQTEEQIRQSQLRLQAVFDGIPEPLLMMDRDMRIKLLNLAALHYYRVDRPEAVVNKACYQALKSLTAPCAGCEVPRAVSQNEFLLFERRGVQDPDRLEEVFVYPLPEGTSQEGGAIIRISDITEARLMERHLVQSEKLASLGLLVAGIAHEINNPNSFITFNIPILRSYLQELLPVVDGYAQDHPDFAVCRMPYGEFRQDIFRLVDNLEHGSSRINATVSALRDFARERGKGEKTEFDLQAVIGRVVSICQGRVRKTAKTFTVKVPAGLPPMSSDPLALEQILVNLLINAAQALDKLDKKESWIKLQVALGDTREGRFIIEVSDNGCGMDEATRQKIFDPFFTTKQAGSGTGLGLSIVHRLVEELGGRIEVLSQPGQGTTFRLFLSDKAKGR